MNNDLPDIRHWLQQELPLIAILRGVQPESAAQFGNILFKAGFRIIEVPLNSPRPLESVGRLAGELGDRALIGAGTITDVAQVDEVAAAGGRIAVSPHFDQAVVERALDRGLAPLPGVFTATELFAAHRAGARAVKLFPAEVAPPSVVRALATIKPDNCALIPVGGVTPDDLGDHLTAGAAGAGLGGSLYRPDFDSATLAGTADDFARAAQAWRASHSNS